MAASETRIRRQMSAPRDAVYRALLDARAVQTWMVPDGMTSHVHAFDPREGGAFRISLTYDAPTGQGKTRPQTDTHHGRFVRLVPSEQVVQVVEFETDDPALQGEMTITFTLADAQGGEGGTEILAVHEGVPEACPPPRTSWGGRCPWRSSRRWWRQASLKGLA